MSIREVKKDCLTCKIYNTREDMGRAAAIEIAKKLRDIIFEKGEANVVFAAAPSQNDVLNSLQKENVEWNKVNAFHMDEYIGLENYPKKMFAYYLKNAIFDKVPFKSVHYIGNGDIDKICENYTKLLQKHPIDIVCCGIGENAHLAFNDPGVADFKDDKVIKVVELDEICRQQQVNDKTFDYLEEVPKYAVTLTIPTMVSAKYMFCVVPTAKKAKAVYDTLYADITETTPSSIMRTHPNTVMYLDKESSALI